MCQKAFKLLLPREEADLPLHDLEHRSAEEAGCGLRCRSCSSPTAKAPSTSSRARPAGRSWRSSARTTCRSRPRAAAAAPAPPATSMSTRTGCPGSSRPNPDESMMLDEAFEVRDNSRLSCQIKYADALDGLRVTLAPEF